MNERASSAVALVALTGCDWSVSVASPVADGLILLGREGCGAKKSTVSRQHAVLEALAEDVWVLRDSGSTNGTLLNGNPVDALGELIAGGDTVALGPEVWFRFWPLSGAARME